MSGNFVVLDTETTGLEPGSRIVELAAIACNAEGEILDAFNEVMNPGMPIPRDASEVHGINSDMLDGAESSLIVLHDFLDWLPDAQLVIHNAPYDLSILQWEADRIEAELPEIVVYDTLGMAKAIGETKGNSLAKLAEHYKIEVHGPAHRAYTDCATTVKYFLLALKKRAWAPIPMADLLDYRYTSDLPKVIEDLPMFVDDGAEFSFGYVDSKGEKTERTIIPYGWAEKRGEIYFHGWDMMREARRTFRADRVVA